MCLTVCLSVRPSVCASVCLSICVSSHVRSSECIVSHGTPSRPRERQRKRAASKPIISFISHQHYQIKSKEVQMEFRVALRSALVEADDASILTRIRSELRSKLDEERSHNPMTARFANGVLRIAAVPTSVFERREILSDTFLQNWLRTFMTACSYANTSR